jgi:hypothetical protein
MVAAGRTWRRGSGSSLRRFRMNGIRPILNQWPRLEDTPSRGNLSKESLDFFIIEPTVLNVLSEMCFRVLKAYFLPVYSKIRFQEITVLPLELFWS